jgi:uncharacterized protein YndB with AHSA1/START domain
MFEKTSLMKEKLELEYSLNTSPKVLFSRLSTPSGLSEWFADNVDQSGNVFTFHWDGTEEKADVVNLKENKCIRFKWIGNKNRNDYFEFRIHQQDLTGELALHITDFVDKSDIVESISLWDKQVSVLKRVIGL